MSTCPSCGRDPGTSDICPHCGADLVRRLRVRVLGIVSIVVAVLSLALLLFFATHTPVPRLKIDQIQPNANYAYAQIDGVVTRGPNYHPDSQALTFWVRDDTGELMVSAFRDQTGALIKADRLPAPGDTVSIQGTVRVRDNVPALTIDSANALHLTRATIGASDRPIGSLTLDDELHGVLVRGMVRKIREPFDGLRLMTLRDATGAIDVALSTDLEAVLGAAPPITIGQSVQVIGAVTKFEDKPQITVRRGADLTLLEEGVAPARPVALRDVTAALKDQWVRVQGEVEQVTPSVKNTKISLSDGETRVIILIWPDLGSMLPQADLQPGAELAVQGVVNVFRDEVEIVPELAADINLVRSAAVVTQPDVIGNAQDGVVITPSAMPPATATSTALPTPAATWPAMATPALARAPVATDAPKPTGTSVAPAAHVSISSITKAILGERVAVHGKVVDVSSFSAGFKFLLDDGMGKIEMTLFDGDYKFVLNRAGLNLGAEVSAAGNVAEFHGVLELQPESGRDVNIITPGSATNIPITPISRLSKPGQIVALEGKITDVKGFSAGTNVFVDDGTGSVRVAIFNNVLAYVPNAAGLTPGATVRVVGKTGFFGGRMEIVPQLGYDVTVK